MQNLEESKTFQLKSILYVPLTTAGIRCRPTLKKHWRDQSLYPQLLTQGKFDPWEREHNKGLF